MIRYHRVGNDKIKHTNQKTSYAIRMGLAIFILCFVYMRRTKERTITLRFCDTSNIPHSLKNGFVDHHQIKNSSSFYWKHQQPHHFKMDAVCEKKGKWYIATYGSHGK